MAKYPAFKKDFFQFEVAKDIRTELLRKQLHKCFKLEHGCNGWNYSSHSETIRCLEYSDMIKSVVEGEKSSSGDHYG